MQAARLRMRHDSASCMSARGHGKGAWGVGLGISRYFFSLRRMAQVGSVFRGTFALDEPVFDWGASYARPAIPPQDLVIYEMGVRSFTADASAGVPAEDAGTFRGLQAKARFQGLAGVCCCR